MLKKVSYITANIIGMPSVLIPKFDFISNIIMIFCLFFSWAIDIRLACIVVSLIIMQKNAQYRFNVLVKKIGEHKSKSNEQCVYQFALISLIKYILIAITLRLAFTYFN